VRPSALAFDGLGRLLVSQPASTLCTGAGGDTGTDHNKT
jgi:hypothetical protein